MRVPLPILTGKHLIHTLSLLLLLASALIVPVTPAAAGCSSYLGRVTINELYRLSQGGNTDAFTEIKRLDSSIPLSTMNTWNLTLCRNGGGCTTKSLSLGTANLPWLILDNTVIPYTYYDIAGGMDALLTDANGDIIDYVSVANWSSNSSYLTACSYFYDTTANEALDNTFDVRREPDGPGDWNHSTGNSGGNTSNDTNNGTSGGPAVSVPATLSVLQGETASVTVSLDSPAPNGGVTVTFELHDGTAVAGTDYTTPTTLSVTIPKNGTSATIDISTILTDKTGASNFYLVLTGATNAYITSQLTTITINPALNALFHLDEVTWNGTSGEVIDSGIYGNNGTSNNGAYTSSSNPALSGTPGTCRYGIFDGSDNYIQIPDDSSLDFDGDFTVTAWINPASLPSGSGLSTIISKDTNYEFHLDSSGRVYWWWQYNYTTWWGGTWTSSRTLISTQSVSTNSWSHVAIVYSKSTDRQYIYINGSLAGSASYNDQNLDTNNYPLYIGADIDSGSGNLISSRFFNGLIDEVQIYKRALTSSEVGDVYQRRHDCSGGATSLDHIRLTHDGTGLTCEAAQITIEACATTDCSTLYTDPVTVDLVSPTSGWNSDPVSFSGGTSSVLLSQTTAGTISLSATATVPSATNPTRCFDTGGTETCQMTFTDTGIIIDGDDSDAIQESDIVTQLAGKPSNTGFNTKTIRVRAVRKDNNSGACVAAVQNSTISSLVSYLTPDTTTGLSDNTVTAVAANTATLSSSGNTQSLQLAFDANGTAPLSFTSDDAGEYVLRIAMNLPVTDSAGTATGATISTTDDSNRFIVRPLAVFADASGNPKAQSATDSVFAIAGNNFTLNAKALRWTSGRDTDNNGEWDTCTSSTLSDPGTGYSRVPQWDLGQPSPTIQAPAGGSNGTLTYTSNITFSAGNSSANATTVNYDEVGIIQLQTDSGNPFLGEAVSVCTPYIGRFIPAYFDLSGTAIVNRSDLSCSPASSFTYIGEDLQASMTLTAKNSAGNTTSNYIGAFAARFDNSFNVGAIDLDTTSPVNLSSGLSTPTVTTLSDWQDTSTPPATVDGAANFVLTLTLNRATKAGPYDNFTLGVNPVDLDGVALNTLDLDVNLDTTNDHAALPATIMRFGRIQVLDAYGPQTSDLEVPILAQYYDGSGFVDNTDDSCTGILVQSDVSLADVSPDTDSLDVAAGDTYVSAISPTLSTGLGSITLAAPGIGTSTDSNDGVAIVTLGLTNFVYLRDDTDGDGAFNEDPFGLATFGSYRGDDRFLFWQETQ